MRTLRAFLFGIIFGLGLILSGMTDPARVLGFLDWTGNWDPSLAFVMGGAVLTALPFFLTAERRKLSIAGAPLEAPEGGKVDARLAGGSALFGVGWGLAGICPGPGIVALGLAPVAALPFVGGLALGLVLTGRPLRTPALAG
ncbi:DUF6691 family protein [Sandaracinobacteroides sp. A072]|uniref:DUF6691 family protein n=1 Tax=Sandaracinobacteroides sp. A072 TaxID=3461146 RepID=UPI004041D2C8